MKYELIQVSGYPSGSYAIQRIDEDGAKFGIPFDEANSDYQQYIIDTDGGLPIPEDTK